MSYLHPARRSISLRRRTQFLETLEQRRLLAELIATGVSVVNDLNQPVSPVAIGSFVYLMANFWATALPANANYAVRATANGTSLTTNTTLGAGVSGTNSYQLRLGQFRVGNAPLNVVISVDAYNTVAESNEVNNVAGSAPTTTTFTPKFSTPIGGVPYQDWTIVNYVDIDRNSTNAFDYNGGGYIYDGHDALDITLANFREMDGGVKVLSAAAGTIVETHFGEFDRNTEAGNATANYIVMDHGGGWRTYYYHLRNVQFSHIAVGQTLQRGSILGYVGSSGSSTDAHLHFAVYYNRTLVETYTAPSSYWENPLTYAGNVKGVLDGDFTSPAFFQTNYLKERPPIHRSFLPGKAALLWGLLHGVNAADNVRFRFVRPDGSTAFEQPYNTTVRYGWLGAQYTLPANAMLGTWFGKVFINGTEAFSRSFEVSTEPQPQMRIMSGSTYLLPNRTTPLQLGTTMQGMPMMHGINVTVFNDGDAMLNYYALTASSNLQIDTPSFGNIDAHSSLSFSVTMNGSQGGFNNGTLAFNFSDPDSGEGTISGLSFEGIVLDNLDPWVLNTAHLRDEHAIELNFNECVTIDPAQVYLRAFTDPTAIPVTIVPHPTSNTGLRIAYPPQLPSGNYYLDVPTDAVTDGAGHHMTMAYPSYMFSITRGDVDGDGTVGFGDLLVVAQNYGQSGRTYSQGNLDYDPAGLVNFDDLLIVAQTYASTGLTQGIALGRRRVAIEQIIA